VTSTGGVRCWGANWSGQLGDGTTTDRVTPANVVGLHDGVTDITAGRNHTCAVTGAGGVRCWGYNWSGRLGDGTTTDRATPVDVIGLSSGVTAIAASEWHTCAAKHAGDVHCWGRNNYGQLGDGTTTNRMTPVAVTGFDAVYDLRGRVQNSSGTGVSGVTIAAGSETTTTASDGTYTLSGLAAGSYTINASKTNCTFAPSSRSVSVPPDATGQNFTATCTIPDTTPPDGYITAPSAGQTIGPSTITFSASAWDNSGGSGVDRVEYRVYYNGFWHDAGSDSSSPYAVSWTPPDGLTSQHLQFAIWVYDQAGNYVVDPGGKVYVNFEAPTISSISGTVTDNSGNGVSGVTLSAGSTSTTTASNGTYTLNGLAAGTYTVTAAKTDCTFSPSSRSVSVPPDATSQNFTADCTVPTYTVSGQVTDGSGNGVSNVTITGGGQSITTSSNGSYTISGLTSGSYTIRASKTNCTFSPSSHSVSVPPDRSGRNFTASCTTPTYTVSGRVTNSDGNAVSGVTISAGGKTATTNSNGSYTISGLAAGNYNISASKDGYTFEPASRSVSVPPDTTGQDFTATQLVTVNPQVSVSPTRGVYGTVFQEPGSGFTPGGQVRLEFRHPDGSIHTKIVQADASGRYSNSYTMPNNALLGQYRYRALDVSSNMWSNSVYFTVEAEPTFTIAGRVLDTNDHPVEGVIVTLSTNRSTTTRSDGSYTLRDLEEGTYTVTPYKEGYTFSPEDRLVTVPPSQTSIDFRANSRQNRYVDLTISLYNNPSSSQRAAYERILEYFADGVYESSNGVHQIRNVRMYTNKGYFDQANVQWIDRCGPQATVSGFERGGHVYMCDAFGSYNFLTNDTAWQNGGYVLAHEWGHYFYSLRDEYRKDGVPCTGTPSEKPQGPCEDDIPVVPSIMNAQWRAIGGEYQWLNFSTALNDTHRTSQHRTYLASGWETLARPTSEDPFTWYGRRYPRI